MIPQTAFAFLVSAIAALLVPDRLNTAIPILQAFPGRHVLVLPAGFWLISLAYIAVMRRYFFVPAWKSGALMFLVHALLLLADVVPEVRNPAVLPGVYRAYAVVVVVAVLIFAALSALRFARTDRSGAVLWLPLLLLAYAVLRHDPALALPIAVVAGVMLAARRVQHHLLSAGRRLLDSEAWFVAAIFVFAAAIRIVFAYRVMANPRFLESGPDGPLYDQLGWSFAQGQGVTEQFSQAFRLMLLGYPRFVGAIYGVAGHSYLAVCIVQALLGGAACVLAYYIARSIFSPLVGRIAAIFAAANLLLIWSAASLAHQAVDVFLTALLVWLVLRYVGQQHPGVIGAGLIGVVLAAAIANRETVASVWLFLLFWIPWSLYPRFGWRFGAARALVISAAMFAILAPVLAPIVINGEEARIHLNYLFAAADRKELVSPIGNPDGALRQIRAEPGVVIAGFARSVRGNFESQFLDLRFKGFDPVFLVGGSTFFVGMWADVYLLTIIGVGLALVLARRSPAARVGVSLIFGVVIVRTALHLALNSMWHHRAPIEPLLIILASVTAARLAEAFSAPSSLYAG